MYRLYKKLVMRRTISLQKKKKPRAEKRSKKLTSKTLYFYNFHISSNTSFLVLIILKRIIVISCENLDFEVLNSSRCPLPESTNVFCVQQAHLDKIVITFRNYLGIYTEMRHRKCVKSALP